MSDRESKWEWITESVDETKELARRLADYLAPGDLLTLEGDLGAGKTSFTQGLAQGLKIPDVVNSPTFTIIKEYQGRIPLYHMDVYRVGEELESLGYEEYFYGDGVTVVEWAGLVEDLLPAERLDIRIEKEGDERRRIVFAPRGARFESICKEIGK